jgi:hypothetical protein
MYALGHIRWLSMRAAPRTPSGSTDRAVAPDGGMIDDFLIAANGVLRGPIDRRGEDSRPP